MKGFVGDNDGYKLDVSISSWENLRDVSRNLENSLLAVSLEPPETVPGSAPVSVQARLWSSVITRPHLAASSIKRPTTGSCEKWMKLFGLGGVWDYHPETLMWLRMMEWSESRGWTGFEGRSITRIRKVRDVFWFLTRLREFSSVSSWTCWRGSSRV